MAGPNSDMGIIAVVGNAGTQDTIEVATHKQTKFEDLSFDLQEKIFTCIESKSQLQKARSICRTWNNIISESFGIKLVVNNINYNLLYTSRNAIEIELNSMTIPINEPQVASMKRLRTLVFRNIVVSYNLMPFLQSAQNLNELRCYEAIVDLPEELIVIPQSPLTNIEKLYFRYWNFGSSLVTILCCLIKMRFGGLKEVQIDTGTTFTPLFAFQKIFERNSAHSDLSAVHPLVRLLIQNINSLELFVFGSLFCPIRFKFYRDPGNLLSEPDREEATIPQLEELVISHIFHTEFLPILSTQTKLKVLDLGCCKVESWRETRNCVVTNSKTLQKVLLRSRTFGQVWNCDIFANTTVLQELTLKMPTSPKTNVHCLPITLKKLEMDGLFEKAELVQLLNLNNLEELKLFSLGLNLLNVIPNHEADLRQRLELDLLKAFLVKLPKLTLLSFQDCTANSINWDTISQWLQRYGRRDFGLIVEFHFYDAQGQAIMHGFTLGIPTTLDRATLAVELDRTLHEVEGNGTRNLMDEMVVVACCSLFF